MNSWNNIYKKGGKNYTYYDIHEPHEYMEYVSVFFLKNKVSKVLDLGCGVGRNLLYLVEKGFNTYGIDISPEGVQQTQKMLPLRERSKVSKGDVFKPLPYKDNFFDAIVSVQVMQHATEGEIKKTIKEIFRIIKPGGYIFVTLCGRYSNGKLRYCLVKTAKRIKPHTYKPTIGDEKGLVHFIYNKQLVKKHYNQFKMLKMWKDSKDYYCFVAQKDSERLHK